MTDIRVQLENELDNLQEENVESWIQRCFEACDPRYDSDWLSGMLELAHMQFPEHYEVRSACSRATVLEARRLSGEGDVKEAVRRLEQLLESDPYCTEGFELLEELTKPEETPPVVAAAPAAEPPPLLQESTNFDDVLGLTPAPPLPEPVVETQTVGAEELLAIFENEDIFGAVPEVVANHAAVEAPAVAAAPAVEASVATAAPVTAAPTAAAPVATRWDELWQLPHLHSGGTKDPQYLQVVMALSEKMRSFGRADAAMRLLADHRRELQDSGNWTDHVKSNLLAWTNQLIQDQHGSQAAQVCTWGAQVVPESAELRELASDLSRRFGLPTAAVVESANPWKQRLEAAPGDVALLEEVWQNHMSDADGMLMLFRQIAVEHAEDSRHILNLGWAYLKAGTAVLALVHTQRALKLSPTRRAYQILADTYEKLGQHPLREAALRSLQETAAP